MSVFVSTWFFVKNIGYLQKNSNFFPRGPEFLSTTLLTVNSLKFGIFINDKPKMYNFIMDLTKALKYQNFFTI